MTSVRYTVRFTPPVRRALSEPPPVGLPPTVAFAVAEFINGPLRDNPHRVGKPLDPPMDGIWAARRGEYRVLYRIDEKDEVIIVTSARHRGDAYRT
ncbi:type II toxin-antitoxin system RelE/ParE family toxin [Phytomonospora sp. NPDC050363]|uniref:type II toxin-antitoxin system RelE family toxin n=1 Tax=Phytomonospora sp. NPDC050363 TaxID=3155642 RepID=UPI0034112065